MYQKLLNYFQKDNYMAFLTEIEENFHFSTPLQSSALSDIFSWSCSNDASWHVIGVLICEFLVSDYDEYVPVFLFAICEESSESSQSNKHLHGSWFPYSWADLMTPWLKLSPVTLAVPIPDPTWVPAAQCWIGLSVNVLGRAVEDGLSPCGTDAAPDSVVLEHTSTLLRFC